MPCLYIGKKTSGADQWSARQMQEEGTGEFQGPPPSEEVTTTAVSPSPAPADTVQSPPAPKSPETPVLPSSKAGSTEAPLASSHTSQTPDQARGISAKTERDMLLAENEELRKEISELREANERTQEAHNLLWRQFGVMQSRVFALESLVMPSVGYVAPGGLQGQFVGYAPYYGEQHQYPTGGWPLPLPIPNNVRGPPPPRLRGPGLGTGHEISVLKPISSHQTKTQW